MVGGAMTAMRIEQVNGMAETEFVEAFGDIAEHSPWVAGQALESRPFANRNDMISAFENALRSADRDRQLALIRAHPDLAGRAKLTADSASEQAGAGLDTLSQSEFERFNALNDAYKEKFDFPFIFAVKGATKHQIVEAFEIRLNSSLDEEFETAISQICRIFRFRIEDRVI